MASLEGYEIPFANEEGTTLCANCQACPASAKLRRYDTAALPKESVFNKIWTSRQELANVAYRKQPRSGH